MREAYNALPPVVQMKIAAMLQDPLYQQLAQAATRNPPQYIVLEHYLSLLHYSGAPNDRRTNIGRGLARRGVPKISAKLKDLFGQHQWNGLPLERPLREDDIPNPERLCGNASTCIVAADDFADFLVKSDMTDKDLLGGLFGAEVVAHKAIADIVSTQDSQAVDPESLIRFRHNSQMSSPNWQMFTNKREGVFAILNLRHGAGRREREYTDHGFTLFNKKAKVQNPAQIFGLLRDALRRDKAWSQKHMELYGNRRVVFYLQHPKASVWDHVDSSLFDSVCKRWLQRVFKLISCCLGVTAAAIPHEEGGDDDPIPEACSTRVGPQALRPRTPSPK